MANSTATANIIVTANTQGAKSIVDLFNETKRGLDQTTNAHKHAAGAAKEHSISIVDLAAKLYLVQVGLRNIRKGMEAVYEFAKLGAIVEQTGISFERVITNAGQTVGMLDQLRAASKGTASDIALMQMSNQALVGTTGEFKDAMAAALPMLLEMARASAILNPQLGSTEHQFDRLTLGLKRLEPRILDDIGLELRLTQVNKEYADQVGKSVDALTVEERSFALLNAVLAKHNDYVKLAGDNAESAVDPYNRLEATATNLKNTLATDLNPSLSELANKMNDALGSISQFIENKNVKAFITGFLGGPFLAAAYGLNVISVGLEKIASWNPPQKLLDFILSLQSVDLRILLLQEAAKAYQDLGGQIGSTAKSMQEYEHWGAKISGTTQVNIDLVTLMTEEERKWAEQKEKTLDNLFMKELEANEKLLEERRKLAQKSVEIDTEYQDRLTEIHEDAEQDRIDLAQRAGEERENIARRYNDRIADIDKSIAELRAEYENKNPFLSDATQQELTDVEQNAKSLQDTIKALRREQRLAPTDAREQLISDYEARLQEVEDHLTEIRNRAREEERKARIAFRIQELQDEKKALEERRDQELAAINAQLQAKLDISIAKEEELTSAIEAEYIKRRIALNDQLNQIAEEADKKLKEAVVDAMLALVPAGSTAAQALMEMKWKMHGATDEMIQDFMRTKASIDGQDGLVGAIDRFAITGFGTFFGMQGVIAGLNGQLMFTNFLLGQIESTTNNINNISGGGGGHYRQHGGPVSANRPYIVGEAGPELFVPSGGGNIVPNDRIGNGGATVNISINATAFQGSQADAIKFGNWVAPIVLQYMDRFGGNANAVGAKRIRSR